MGWGDLLIDFIPQESHFIILCVFNPSLTTATLHGDSRPSGKLLAPVCMCVVTCKGKHMRRK